MCTRRLVNLIGAVAVAFVAWGCMPTGDEGVGDSDVFVVGGARGGAAPGGDSLEGGLPPGSFGSTGSVGIGGAGSPGVFLGTGSGLQDDFRLLSTANGRLVQLLVDPPTLVPIGAANLAGTAIATAPDGTLFGLTSNFAGSTRLVEISPITGAVTPVGPVDDVTNLTTLPLAANPVAFAPNGTLFVSPGNAFLGVDPITGQITPVLTNAGFGAFTFAPSGTLVGTTAAGLGVIDINTGTTTSVLATGNQIPFAPSIQGMTFAPDGFIYAVSNPFAGQSNLVRIDPATGVSVLLATYNSNLFGLAVQPL